MPPGFGICMGALTRLTADQILGLPAAGIECVEIGGPKDRDFDYLDGAHLDRLAAAINEAELVVWSMHGPFCGMAMDDASVREQATDLLIRAARAAVRLGVRRMVLHPGRDVLSEDIAREIAWCRQAIARALDAIPASLTLAIETCPPPWLGMRCDDLLAIIDGFDPARVGICLDTGHWNMAGHLAASARAAAGRIVTVHIHDSEGEVNDHQMPGDGAIDWPQLIDILREGGYGGPLMLEVGPKERPLAEHFAEYTRRMARWMG